MSCLSLSELPLSEQVRIELAHADRLEARIAGLLNPLSGSSSPASAGSPCPAPAGTPIGVVKPSPSLALGEEPDPIGANIMACDDPTTEPLGYRMAMAAVRQAARRDQVPADIERICVEHAYNCVSLGVTPNEAVRSAKRMMPALVAVGNANQGHVRFTVYKEPHHA